MTPTSLQRTRLASCIIFLLLTINRVQHTHARLGKSNIFIEDDRSVNTTLNGSYIVIFADSNSSLSAMSEDTISSLADELGNKYLLEKKAIFSDALYGFSASNVTKEDLENLQNEESVMLVEMDGILSNDPMEDEVDDELNASMTGNITSQAYESSGDIIEGTISGQQGEIIPAGVRQVGWRNVEGNNAIMKKRVFIIDSGLTDSSNEFNIDKEKARNFVSGENANNWSDCHGHGTHIAGTIAARRNGKGVVGVAAGAMVVPIRVLDCTNNGQISDVVAAINYVATLAYPGDVVNLSIGAPISQTSIDIAIERAASNTGATFVVAAGNGSTLARTYSPARVQANNVYTVCALGGGNAANKVASYSNFGRPPVDVCAPGTGIVSLSRWGGTSVRTGTSMAAPHVAGALVFGQLKTNGFARDSRDVGRRYPIVAKR